MPRCLRADARRDALLPRLATDEARCVLKRKWLYIIGDSSTRFLTAALLSSSLLNLSRGDSHFGTFTERKKLGCSNEGVECLREFVDFDVPLRVTFSFNALAKSMPANLAELTSEAQQPDLILFATGAWDIYQHQTAKDTFAAVVDSVKQLETTFPRAALGVATLVSCNHCQQHPATCPLNRFIRNHKEWGPRTFIVDREPSTVHENVTQANKEGDPLPGKGPLRCEGFHAYGDIALHHLYLLLSQFAVERQLAPRTAAVIAAPA